MSIPVIYANTQYVAAKHTFITIPESTNLSLTSLTNVSTSNVMTIVNGNVGIGTTIPRQLLDIQGGNMIMSGNVGIGTTIPRASLHVNGDIQTPVLVGCIMHFARKTAPIGWLKCNGSTVSRTVYASLFSALVPSYSTVTITIASPAVITWNSHGLQAGDILYFTTTGALPTGITAITTAYYVISTGLTQNTFQISTTSGGTAVNTSGTQSGIHTAWNAPFGIGDGSTTFTLPDLRGEFLRSWDDARSVDISRAFGTAQSYEVQSHNHGGSTAGAGAHAHTYQRFQPNDTTAGQAYRDTWSTTQYGYAEWTSGVGDHTHSFTTASTGGVETRPRNVALLACIKY